MQNASAIRPGQLLPNEFELAILSRMSEEHPSLRPFLGQLHVLNREYTGVGSFTNFDTDAEEWDRDISLNAMISMPNIPNGLGAVLFCQGDRPKCLEIYAFGDDRWDGLFDGFSIGKSG